MTNPKPKLPPIGQVFNGANIPEQLKAMRRWSVWKAVWNDVRQKYDKIPYHPNHYGLSTKKVSDWVDFESAAATLRLNPHKYCGLGFVLTDVQGVVGVDLDNCLRSGRPVSWARDVVDALGSYTEVSPSGKGLRILALGTTATDWTNHDVGIEVYSGHTPRFLTITGDKDQTWPMAHVDGTVMADLFTRYGKARVPQANVIPIAMPELLHELALPDVADMDIPEDTRELLLHGPADGVDDRSGALHAAGVRRYSAGYDDAQVLSILAASQPVMDIALSHRRQDPERALAYLWVEHCQKAKPKATTKDSILADFEDVSQDPEVLASAKKSDEAKAVKEARFKLETATEFAVRRKASWIVKGLIPMATLGVIYGASGSGKSFFALDLMAAVARAVMIKKVARMARMAPMAQDGAEGSSESKGPEWCGHKVNPARVCWIAAEGVEDMRKRVQGYAIAQGISLDELPMEFIGEAPSLLEDVDVKAVIKQMRAKGRFDLVVIDTLAQVMAGGNENSGEDMGKVLAYCREITRLTGAMVLLIHHSGKDESRGARGWSGLRAAADFEFEIIRADDERVAIVTKMKGGEDGGEYGFRLVPVVVGLDEDGDEETTCVLAFTDSNRHSIQSAQEPNGDIGKALVDALNLAGGMTRNELVTIVAATRPRGDAARDQRKTNVNKGLNTLVQRGTVTESGTGMISLPEKKAVK